MQSSNCTHQIKTDDIELVMAYCAAKLVYGNSQWSGLVKNLTTNEFLKRREDPVTEEIVMSCHHYKTGPQGAAKIAMNKSTEEILESYFKYVRTCAKPNEGVDHLFFYCKCKKVHKSVSKNVRSIFATKIYDFKLPAPTKYRILVTIECSKELSDKKLSKVARHMSHSSHTAKRYYEFTDESDVICAHQTIVQMAK